MEERVSRHLRAGSKRAKPPIARLPKDEALLERHRESVREGFVLIQPLENWIDTLVDVTGS